MRILQANRLVLAVGLIAVITGCNQPDFPKYTDLGSLRLLTIIADKPEANPGDTVIFTPVLSDLNGQGRTIQYSVQGCIDPGVGNGVNPGCPNPDVSSMQSGTVALLPGNNNTYTGPVASFSLTMPDDTRMFANRSAADQYNGVAYLVFYSISIPDGPAVNSFLRVIVSTSSKTQKNQNPVITSVDLNDVPITGEFPMPGSTAPFRVIDPTSSAETYQILTRDGSFTTHNEELITTWFVTDGLFDSSRTIGNSENSWKPPASKPVNRGIAILVVTRDGRGGSAYQKIEMN